MSKSPLKDKPLRNPGESLDQEIDRYFDDEIQPYLLFPTAMMMFAAYEWFRWSFNIGVHPVVLTLMAVGTRVFSIIKIIPRRKHFKNLKQGRDGEKAVGQFLETLRESGAKVFHDVPCGDFNLDHVVVASSGVYLIETKTFSKPDRGKATILYDGKSLWISGGFQTDAPVVQAKAAANWLKDLVKQSTGLVIPVQPVVLFPGWYIESSKAAKASEVWVLNPKALPSFMKNREVQLAPDKVSMIALHLSRFIRTSGN